MRDTSSDAALLMGRPPDADALREELALASVQRRLFDSRAPAPVLRRYVLLEAIGRGGFGVVLRAYDPDLEREVAVKLLRVEAASAAGVEGLLREARIMAQLSHPNTVTVHDVGRYARSDLGCVGSQVEELGIPTPGVFLVMELVERGSLQQQIDGGLSPRDALPMLLDAGRGIAAAHALGVVHRDVKPANVLVDGEGRVRVCDFGLSQPIDAGVRDAAGTKVYMAPERLAGGPATPACDQYSFALMCAVALWGVQPGRARTLLHGSATTPRGVPRRLRAVLARALSPAPSDRHPSMAALVDAMEAASRPRRRRLLVGGVVLGATTAALLAMALSGEDPCAHAGEGLAATWSPRSRASLARALARSDAPHASESSEAVVRALDGYAQRWASAARDACTDTHVRHVQSPARLDARVDCLGRLRVEFGEAVALLSEADPKLSARAVEVVHGLGWIAACEDPSDDPARLPEDPDARTRHAERSRRLARAKLLEISGRYAEAMALADEVVVDPDTGPVQRAQGRLRFGSAAASRGRYELAQAALLESIQGAEAARADAIVVDGWLRLLWVAGVELGEAEGEVWAGFARAALDRLGEDPRREAELAHGLGGLAYRAERYDEALTHYQTALRLQQTVLGSDDPTIARTLNHIANVLIMLEDFDGAERYIEQSLAIRRRVLGDHHPLVAAALNNRVLVHLHRGDLHAARATLAESEAITAGQGGPEAGVGAELRKRLLAAEAQR